MKRRSAKSVLASVALAVVSVVVGVGLFEVVARIALGPPADAARRLLFFSGDTFAVDACGAVHYTPSRTVRTVAVYGSTIAYDVRFDTNNLGYVDEVDYPTSSGPGQGRSIAFIGDSFTAGYHDGPTWIGQLREATRTTHPDLRLYNLGVGATGLAHFHTSLRCFSGHTALDEIVVLFISDDLRRVPWVPAQSKDLIHLCFPADCSQRRVDLFKLASEDETPSQLLARAQEIYEARAAGQPASRSTWRWLERSTHAGRMVSRIKTTLGHDPAADSAAADERAYFTPADRRAIAYYLERFREDFSDKNVTFMHLPEKTEVRRGAYYDDVASLFTEHGLTYVPLLERCKFSDDGFLELDAHPNRQGYTEIMTCMRSLLALE